LKSILLFLFISKEDEFDVKLSFIKLFFSSEYSKEVTNLLILNFVEILS